MERDILKTTRARSASTRQHAMIKVIWGSVLAIGLCQPCSAEQRDLGPDYWVQNPAFITTRDGATISAIVVRKKSDVVPAPTVLQFTIYVRPETRDMDSLKEIADRGYVAVIAYTRGKYQSPDAIAPYEHDGKDATAVIDWISQQTWSNGSVGMFGGSYNGFTQWAAAKYLHPALKTIVPYVANRPGMGLPMENNVFVNPNYQWAFYVGNSKTLDTVVNNDRARFRKMQFDWWYSGKAYRQIDQIDGTPNPWLQRWLQHPNYDAYWQGMVPYQQEFADITIPVLSIDGYYNDSQASGLYYLREQTHYQPAAEHYLIIGPYGHFGAQRGGEKIINGYAIDSTALIDTKAITFAWLDHVLKGGPKPGILQDKVNYQVMGANEWRHAPSLAAMADTQVKLYFSANQLRTAKHGVRYELHENVSKDERFLSQTVDFKNRHVFNNDYYPESIVSNQIDTSNGFIFVSAPLPAEMLVNGSFSGEVRAIINKRDFDFGVTLYELRPDGRYFHLSYVVGRASYARDPTQRRLLTPGRVENIPLPTSKLVSKKVSKGSRLVVYLNVNKNPFSQLNYGTGKDVSDETIADATEKLRVQWSDHSFISVPVLRSLK